MGNDKIKEDKEKIKKDKKDKKEKIEKIKQNIIMRNSSSFFTAKCRVEEIIDNGYILRIIKCPSKQVNIDYKINDLFEYPTFNKTYQVDDIIEYTFKHPLTRKSKVI